MIKTSARFLFLSGTLFSSVYALLCYLPSTWTNFIANKALPIWAQFLTNYYGLAIVAFVAAAAWVLGKRRWIALSGILLAAALSTIWPWMKNLGNTPISLLVSLGIWIPYILWEILLALPSSHQINEPKSLVTRPLYHAALFSGVFQCCVALANYVLWAGRPQAAWPALSLAIFWTMTAHIIFFLAIAALIDACSHLGLALSLKTRLPSHLLLGPVFWAVITVILQSLVLGSFTFTGPLSWLYAAVVAASLTLAFHGESAQWLSPDQRFSNAGSPFDFWASPALKIQDRIGESRMRLLVSIAILAVLPFGIRRIFYSFDWNRLLETLATAGLWLAGYLFFYAWSRRQTRLNPLTVGTPWTLLAAAMILVWGARSLSVWASPWLALRQVDPRSLQQRWEGEEISLKTVRRLIEGGSNFYQYLQQSTNLPRSVKITAPNIQLWARAPAQPPRPPAIFLFSVDSLRQDYLGAYNSNVAFTPNLDRFAKDSLVFRNAFTAYGATGLSEPSIWTGARMAHQQYVQPFAPLNSLEKLLNQHHYRRFITVDLVLRSLLTPSTMTVELDSKTPGSYKFCSTLSELEGKLESQMKSEEPLFVFTQPQNIHISVITHEGAAIVEPGSFEGFYAPYASRIQSFDRCFGQFIDFLKAKGLYDSSIIIFTADHGDSLGEGGRWGHAYTLFPEILRIPLIMHVPSPLLEGRAWDLNEPAFSLDITPTLYSLLDYSPFSANGIYGRPLIASDPESLKSGLRSEHLFTSSYGPVYALLQEGRWLYIADGVNFTNYYFDLKNDPAGRINITNPAIDEDRQAALLWHLKRLNAFYGFSP